MDEYDRAEALERAFDRGRETALDLSDADLERAARALAKYEDIKGLDSRWRETIAKVRVVIEALQP